MNRQVTPATPTTSTTSATPTTPATSTTSATPTTPATSTTASTLTTPLTSKPPEIEVKPVKPVNPLAPIAQAPQVAQNANCIALFMMLVLQDLLVQHTANPITNFINIIAISGTIANLNASVKNIEV